MLRNRNDRLHGDAHRQEITSQPVALTDEAFALFVNHLAKFLFKRELDKEVCAEMTSYRELVLGELETAKKKVAKE